jgi:hypothetical protein
LLDRLEGEKPKINSDLPSAYLGRSQTFTLRLSDSKSGLRKLWVGLLKDGKEAVLHDAAFPSAGFFKDGKIRESDVEISVEPSPLGFSDGEAILRMVVSDYSWRDWWRGNKTYIEKKVVIDTRSPEIEVISRAHNINQGGAGLVIFRTSEPCSQSGVQVGDQFYPGYAGYFSNPRVHLAFIALGYQQGTDSAIFVKAVDLAGNRAQGGINYHLRRKVFRKDRINLSDRFLNQKVPDLSSEIARDANTPSVEVFLKINRDLREANYRKIVQVCRETDEQFHWEGIFLRLPKSATRARFADHRTYLYKGREIDRQVHLGIDLASVANSPVPAANGGIVIFAGSLGIYGKTVILDHGFNLFSMYSHLSQIGVKTGDRLSRGDVMGRTGRTGLAGGDHLHFGMMVGKTFVNPIEWWDQQWIHNNVISKIEWARSRITQE